MTETHLAYLNLGSNIRPEFNLVKAIELLQEHGQVLKVSGAWESRSVGAPGPNYLNACVLFASPFMQVELKERIIRPIEAKLERKRSRNKYSPRTIDIDIVLFDEKPYNERFWRFAFVILPLAEIHPDYLNPLTNERITQTASRLRREVWIEPRPVILSRFARDNGKLQI